tara:strand:+ start:2283 stop:2495 length:213 start_codon:yes stop_codon:yes gene_type:complete
LNLSEQQKKAYKFIQSYNDETGFCPTLREIANHLSISVNATREKLNALKKKGLVEWTPRTPRTIRTTDEN